MIGTQGTDLVFINEAFEADSVSAGEMDALLASAWRHFGTYFFRYNLGIFDEEIRRVLPLRVRLADFRLSKSQRRCINRNADLRVEVRPTHVTVEAADLFHGHKVRFESSVPTSLYDFLAEDPATVPSPGKEVAVYDGDRLVAASYFDDGETSTSGIYAMFDLELAHRRLGIFTMLKEIEYSIDTGRQYYYPGFAYEGPSFYDYKKRFAALEYFDWQGHWLPYTSDE